MGALRTKAVSTALIAVLAGIAGPLVQAQGTGPVRLLADINERPSFDAGSFAYDFVRLGGIVLFVAESRERGRALWRTDGTSEGTTLVKDINPGSYYDGPSGLIAFGGAVYFGADDGIHGPELWRSDGTEAGTVLVKDIYPGPRGSLLLANIVVFQGALLFKANDGVHGTELWKSDGTEAGTVLVKDTDPATTSWGGASGNELTLTEAGGALFFTSLDFIHGSELWKTDGTEAGTLLVKDIDPGINSAVPGYSYYTPVELNGVLYFQASTRAHGMGVWRSDGTEAGTFLIKDIAPGYGFLAGFAKAAGLIFFVADDEVHGWELWRTDGTETGTFLVGDISPGPTGSYPRNLTGHAGALYFFASEDYASQGLWRSDGTPEGTVMALSGTAADWLTECHGDLYFANSDGIHGMELWRSDGTEGGTALLKDIYPGPSASFYWQTFTSPLTDVDGTLYFIAEDGVHGAEVWTSDGTAGGTILVKDINGFNENYGSAPYETARIGDTLYFSALNTLSARNLYRTDGTQAGTALVKDFGRGFDPGIAGSGVVVGGTMFFPAQDAEHALELWKSDGTEAGTVLVKDINIESIDGYPLPSSPLSLTVHDGTVFFAANDGLHGYELWKSDGTEAGTIMVKDIDPDSDTNSVVGYFSETRGGLVFGASDGVHGIELWRTDGTEGGTYLVKDINPGPSSSFSSLSVLRPTLDGEAYFLAFDPTHGTELWKSDGTEAGTILIKDLCPGSCHGLSSLFLSETKVIDGNLYFGTIDSRSGGVLQTELWRTDGTEAGTVRVKAFYPAIPQRLSGFFDVAGTLFFRANDGIHGQELWKSDGSEAGTVLVKDITPDGYNPPSSPISYGIPLVVGDTLYFTADDGVHGLELWKSDGTEDGTVLVEDIRPGLDTSQPTQLTEIEGAVLFRADDGVHGVEMWRSDGTEEGTTLVQDIAPGSDGSGTFFSSLDPTRLGSRVIFATNDVLHGFEPWAGRAAIVTGQPLRAIDDIGAELASLNLPEGLGRVLSRSLDLASQALEREDGRQAAIDAMTRFLRKVQVLSHRMITDEQRASLVAFAQEIIDFLESASLGGDDDESRVTRDRGRGRGRRGTTPALAGGSHEVAGSD